MNIKVGEVYIYRPGAHAFTNDAMRNKYTSFTGVKVRIVKILGSHTLSWRHQERGIFCLYEFVRADDVPLPPSKTATAEYRAAEFELYDPHEVLM